MNLTPATILFMVVTAASLAIIQIRRIIKGELPLIGYKAFTSANKIILDKTDKILMLTSVVSFIAFLILLFKSNK